MAQTRLILSTAVASEYAGLVHLYTLRDNAAQTLAIAHEDSGPVPPAARFRSRDLGQRASGRGAAGKRGGRPAWIDERIGLQRNAIAALLGAGPDRGLAIARPTAQFAGSQGLPTNLSLELLGRRPDIVAARSRTEAAARRIDQQKAGFYPSVNLMAFVGVQSLGIDNLTKSGSSVGSVGSGDFAAHFQHRAAAGPIAGCPRRIRRRCRHLQRDAVERACAKSQTRRPAASPWMGNLPTSRAAVAAAAEAHQIVSQRYQGALATYLDVLTAEDELISAQRAEAELETRALILDVALVRALGGGFSPEASGARAQNPQCRT